MIESEFFYCNTLFLFTVLHILLYYSNANLYWEKWKSQKHKTYTDALW